MYHLKLLIHYLQHSLILMVIILKLLDCLIDFEVAQSLILKVCSISLILKLTNAKSLFLIQNYSLYFTIFLIYCSDHLFLFGFYVDRLLCF